jgi:hypothetical protein
MLALICVAIFSGPKKQNKYPKSVLRRGVGGKKANSFINNSYWSLAWIIQEVVLAKRVDVVAGNQMTELKRLISIYRDTGEVLSSIDQYMEEQVDVNRGALCRQSLLRTLHQFRHTKCAIPQDRIYSLLTLCEEGEDIETNYNNSDERLIRQVLDVCQASLCFCATAIVCDALWFRAGTVLLEEDATPYVEVTFRATPATLRSQCLLCRLIFPVEWTKTNGFIFCLHAACDDMHGHLLWQEGLSMRSHLMNSNLLEKVDILPPADIATKDSWPSASQNLDLQDADYRGLHHLGR